MPTRSVDGKTRNQAMIDALFLIEHFPSKKAAAEFSLVSIDTLTRATMPDERISRRIARLLNEAAAVAMKNIELGRPAEGPKVAEGTSGDVFSHTREALKHFEKGFACLRAAGNNAMPISRPGFLHVEGELRKLLETYLIPMVK